MRKSASGDQDLDSQPMPALGSARTNDRTPPPRLHTNKKTMGSFAANNRRLIGALHGKTPCKKAFDCIVKLPRHLLLKCD